MHELSSSSSLLFYSSSLKKLSWLTLVPAERCLSSTAGIQVHRPLAQFNFIAYLSLKSYDSWGQRQIHGCKVKEKNRIDLKTAFRKELERGIDRNSESVKRGKYTGREEKSVSPQGKGLYRALIIWSSDVKDKALCPKACDSGKTAALYLGLPCWGESLGDRTRGRAVPFQQAWTINLPPGWSAIFPIL